MSAAPKSSEQTFKRFVEVGRVVLVSDGPNAGKLATIVEIVDHNRALIDGPATGVPRQVQTYRRLVLTPFVLSKLTRGASSPVVKKVFEASDVLAKWEKSAWAKRRQAIEKRRNTTDFERFEIMLLKKQRRRIVQVRWSISLGHMKAVAEKKVLLGRPSNNLQIGIVGVPNVGKSSLFNAISKCDLGKIANFPYATIEPEEAQADPFPLIDRFEKLCEIYKPASKIPAFLTCVDIAGLTKGAASGAGLGNNFLANVRSVDGIFQVVRAFDDADVIHVEGEVDPIRDMEVIQTELRLKDIEWVEKKHELLKKSLRGATGTANLADKAKKEELDTVAKVLDVLTVQNKDVRKGTWTNKEIDVINDLLLLTAKPVTYLVNLSERDYIRKKNKWLPKIKAWIDENNPGDLLIPFSVALEERLATEFADDAAREEELKTLNTAGALGKITTAGYASLHLIRYFTCGPQEVRAWTIREGTKAPQAAGVIHTDFEKHFICGDIMSYDDLVEYGSEVGVKAAGKMAQKGKPYEMVDGDIAYWKHNA
ncbi:GTP binding protein [Pseudohyphozyma bogoriensis]|nr:GTP binding protein [Pseudohyphozyma bogoriensis]